MLGPHNIEIYNSSSLPEPGHKSMGSLIEYRKVQGNTLTISHYSYLDDFFS